MSAENERLDKQILDAIHESEDYILLCKNPNGYVTSLGLSDLVAQTMGWSMYLMDELEEQQESVKRLVDEIPEQDED